MWDNIKGIFAIVLGVALLKSCLWPDKADAPVTSTSQPSRPVTAKDLPYPEVGIPGVVPPEGKTVHLNYRKGEPPVAIYCRDVGGKVVCKPAK